MYKEIPEADGPSYRIPMLRSEVNIMSRDMESIKEGMTGLKGDVRVMKADVSELKQEVSGLKTAVGILQSNVSELKDDMKVLQRDVSDMKGDIRAIAAGFGAAQSRFNWDLVILGIIIALVQMLK